MELTIRLLGIPGIYYGDERLNGLIRGQKAWALLARLLLADRPVSRRVVASELFSDTVDPLGSVRWCLASLRRAIGRESFVGDPIRPHLPAGAVVDAWNIASSDDEILHAGQLLEGIEPHASVEFSTWLLVERERLERLVDERIRQETLVAMAAGDYARAIRFAEVGTRRRPFEENTHILLARCLVLAGRREIALQHVVATEKAFLHEIGERPSPSLRGAARQAVSSATLAVAPRVFAESLVQSGVAALSAGAADFGLDCLRRALTEAEALKDNYLMARSLVELGSALVHSVRGFDEEGAILLREAVGKARQCGDDNVASRGLCELGYVEAFAGRRPEAARLLSEAIACSEQDRNRLAGIHSVIGFNLVDWGKTEDGLSHFEISLDHARFVGNRRREIWSLGLGAWGQLAADRPDAARAWVDRCLASCDDVRWLAFRPWPVSVQAAARLKLKEDPRSLRRGLEDAFALSCQLGDPCWEAAVARSMALTYAACQEYEPANRWLAKARNHCLRRADHYTALFAQILSDQMTLNLRIGEVATARTIARELVKVAAETHADKQLRRALEILAEAGALDGASSVRRKASRTAGPDHRASLNQSAEPAL